MSQLINVVRCLDENLGDHFSTPAEYFPWLKRSEKLDPHEGDFSRFLRPHSTPKVTIVGGGGQVANLVDEFDRNLELIARSTSVAIAWGIGHNRHDENVVRYPPYLREFDLVGLRDWTSPYQWVPCASCLHPALDTLDDPTHDVVFYEHWQIPLGAGGGPRMKNSEKSIGDALSFLASGEFVVTNTYHGCYWATLLGRRVVLVEPFSTKFFNLRHPPAFADRQSWQQTLNSARIYPHALDECRDANYRFAERARLLCSKAGIEEARTTTGA